MRHSDRAYAGESRHGHSLSPDIAEILSEAIQDHRMSLNGDVRAVAAARRTVKLTDKAIFRTFVHYAFKCPAAQFSEIENRDPGRGSLVSAIGP